MSTILPAVLGGRKERKRGAHPAHDGKAATHRATIYLSESELAAVKKAATSSRRSVAAWLRLVVRQRLDIRDAQPK